jgi:TolB protein
MKKLFWIAVPLTGAMCLLIGQQGQPQDRAQITITGKGGIPKVAIPDLSGSADTQKFMAAFNETLWSDVHGAGIFDLVAKTSMPKFVPQQPSDFQSPPPPQPEPVRGRKQRTELAAPASGGGRWMKDWSMPPTQANYLAFGYTYATNGVLVLQGWFVDLSNGGQLIAKRYLGDINEAGARKVAHDFAADIIALGGGTSLVGTHIYFVSTRTGHKEIWRMDFDGKNQTQITHFNNISQYPSLSLDGTKIAFTSWVHVQPAIFVFSVDPVRDLRFYNQNASVNGPASFTPDGKVVFSSSAGGCCGIFISNLDGRGVRRLSSSTAIDTEPKVSPLGNQIVFVSGRSGPQQIYRMNMDGAEIERLTPGNGEASNPSWDPKGTQIAFAWTQGYATGNFNIFTMQATPGSTYTQLTHGQGKNENPSWAPDGVHLAFSSTRSGRKQIWSMLADGSQAQQLTSAGDNMNPVWGK